MYVLKHNRLWLSQELFVRWLRTGLAWTSTQIVRTSTLQTNITNHRKHSSTQLASSRNCIFLSLIDVNDRMGDARRTRDSLWFEGSHLASPQTFPLIELYGFNLHCKISLNASKDSKTNINLWLNDVTDTQLKQDHTQIFGDVSFDFRAIMKAWAFLVEVGTNKLS